MIEEKRLWGKLVALTRGLATHALKEKSISMGRNPECQVVVAEKRLSGKHCML
jgi:pSer/pThr/pTyr-binding forkhead associated (FHA) protein